jgi:hypothetical protein
VRDGWWGWWGYGWGNCVAVVLCSDVRVCAHGERQREREASPPRLPPPFHTEEKKNEPLSRASKQKREWSRRPRTAPHPPTPRQGAVGAGPTSRPPPGAGWPAPAG